MREKVGKNVDSNQDIEMKLILWISLLKTPIMTFSKKKKNIFLSNVYDRKGVKRTEVLSK